MYDAPPATSVVWRTSDLSESIVLAGRPLSVVGAASDDEER
ncbi:hypothetical protein [Flexivirga alba]|uniref:Uncharacterized protein n=1 Tax=Flexivirga alba TaxID=702742 RepID=A0ABW2AF57_9MICO